MSEPDRFRTMLRDGLAPRLRRHGFRGSGQRYVMPDEREWRIVAVQRSRRNDATTVAFTVNLFVAGKEEWTRFRVDHGWLRAEPSGTAIEPVGRWLRLGHLLPRDRDRWWTLSASVDPAKLAVEVGDAIVTVGIGWLRGEIKGSHGPW